MVVVEVGSAYLIKVIFVITYAIMDIKSRVNNSAAIQYLDYRILSKKNVQNGLYTE